MINDKTRLFVYGTCPTTRYTQYSRAMSFVFLVRDKDVKISSNIFKVCLKSKQMLFKQTQNFFSSESMNADGNR